MNNRIFASLMALIIVFAFAINISAAENDVTMPDLTQKGSLTLIMDVDGEPLNSGSLNLYRVADVSVVAGNKYDFRLLDELTAIGAVLDTDDLSDAEQVQELLNHAQQALDQCFTQPIRNGKASFTDLDTGLYLVWQSAEGASDGYDAISPFLISVPKLHDGVYSLHVEAKPKVPFVTEPPPPPPNEPPPPPNLPQTGQLKWPVSVMATCGIVLLIVGLILCVDRKRRNREK